MKKRISVLFVLMFLSANLSADLFSKTLEYNSVINLTAVESSENNKTILTVSGLCADSTYAVKKIDVQKIDTTTVLIIITASLIHKKTQSGSFKHSFEIPSDIKSVVFGNVEYEIWNADSPFRTGILTKAPKILPGTTLALNNSQFSETRYEFSSENEGIVRSFMLSYCNECDAFPDGIIYKETEKSRKFLYDSESGKISVDGEYAGTIAHISGDTFVLYNQYEVYSRTIAKAHNLKSAWAKGNRFGKLEYVFYTDGTFTGPLSLSKETAEENPNEDFDMKDRYEELNSIIRLFYFPLPSFRYLLHDGEKLYNVNGYLVKTDRKVYQDLDLTLDIVIQLSKKGNALSFFDLSQYLRNMTGSGLLIMEYYIDENFELVIGGTGYNNVLYANLIYKQNPEYVIDIREEDVEAFIEKCLKIKK